MYWKVFMFLFETLTLTRFLAMCNICRQINLTENIKSANLLYVICTVFQTSLTVNNAGSLKKNIHNIKKVLKDEH